jgi:hypothetical protein
MAAGRREREMDEGFAAAAAAKCIYIYTVKDIPPSSFTRQVIFMSPICSNKWEGYIWSS